MKKILLVIGVLLFSGLVSADSIGTSPGFMDLGELEPGESSEQTFYITADFSQEFSVRPEFRTSFTSRMFDETNERRSETSEKDIEEWIDFDEEAEVDPNESYSVEIGDSSVNANGEFSFAVNVPTDAEPGYHYGAFELNPELDIGGGPGSANWGQTRPYFRFRVSGQAERNLQITDVNGVRIGDERVQIVKQIQNTGTVTTSLRSSEVSILNENGEEVDQVRFGSTKLASGEVAEIDTIWSSEEVSGGTYSLDGVSDYYTGEAHVSGDFAVTDVVRDPVEVDEPEAETEDDSSIPYTLLIMVLLFLGVILYLLEIDLVWTIIFVGVTGIGLFILFSSAPVYLILILVGLIGVTLYYGI